jgi:hypothetical protein
MTETRREDRLVPVKRASTVLGWSADAIHGWVNDGHVPGVRSPGGQLSLYASWLGDVLASARPGEVGDMRAVTRRWWAARSEDRKAAA